METLTLAPPAAPSNSEHADFYALKAEYVAAMAELEAYDRDVYQPAEDACYASLPKEPALVMNLINPSDGTAATAEMSRLYVLSSDAPERLPGTLVANEVLRLRGLLDAHSAECDRIKAEWQLPELEAKHDRLWGRMVALERRLMAVPSPDVAALLFKIETQFADQMEQEFSDSIDMDRINPIIEDARRLLSIGRA